MKPFLFFSLCLACSFPVVAQTENHSKPQASEALPQYDEVCFQTAMEKQGDDTTLAEIRRQCLISETEVGDQSALEKRIRLERSNQYNLFSMQPHKKNYIMPISYHANGTNEKPFKNQNGGHYQMENTELQFQFSLKIALANNLFGLNDHFFVAYTNHSFWQAYNHEISAPFRETNHEPEFWVSFDNNWMLGDWKNRLVDVGLVHQSNGRSGSLSRSWNRAYMRFVFEKDESAIVFKPWYRFQEKVQNDDNPDILDYMGNFELMYATKFGKHGITMMGRNNLDSQDNRGAIELGYSYPLHRNLNAYVQYFYGYGESMIDYNYLNSTISIGVELGQVL